MTIGYDTLELLALSSGKDVFAQPSTSDGGERVKSRVLDLCCGCGIQGIFAAKQSSSWNNPRVQTELVAMDINERAVRFAMGNACLNGLFASDTPSVYSAIEADLYEPVRGSTSSRQIGRFDCILCNPPFVAVPIANDMTGIAPALYAVGGGRDGMNVLRRILEKCFDILDDGEHRQLLMVTELPNVETSCALLSSMLPTAARVNVAYIGDDVETTYDYAKEREVEAGFDIATRDWRPTSNNITNRALALISISRSITSEKNLFCYRNELNRDADEEDQFLTRDGIHFVRENLL
jgi:methylase of polypeptide subunit release factors